MNRVTVSPVLSDGMVVQRDVPLPVSGTAPPDARLCVSFLGKRYYTRAGSGGGWSVVVDSVPAGGPYEMVISDERGGEAVRIRDVYAGDVWLCAGQSNMELPMQRLKDDFPEEWQPPVNPLIRQFKVPQEWDFSGPRAGLSGGGWTAAGPDTLGGFSGTGWFFAQALFERHGVPIGLINTAWGGTPIEAWMSREALAAFPHKIAHGEQYADAALCRAVAERSEAGIRAWESAAAAGDAGSGAGGAAGGWFRPETDSSHWSDIELPGAFAGAGASAHADLAGFCGVLWLRREFHVGADFAAEAAQVWLGTIVDADTVYLNGVAVGSTGYRYPPRKYPVPAGLLREGSNTIVIRVVCCDGQGGITTGKPFALFSRQSRQRQSHQWQSRIELAGTWKYRVGMSCGPRPEAFFFQRLPMGLFNAMIAPLLAAVPCAGILWYQGESNDGNADEYVALFTALINDWREKALPQVTRPLAVRALVPPFLFVQLPLWGEAGENSESSSWAVIRAAQQSALRLPATGMAAALDAGEWNDLHPVDKKTVGRRLALAAEQVVFNQRNTAPGPVYRSFEVRDNRLFITFDNCGAGLTAREQPYVTVIAGGLPHRLPADIAGPDCLSVDIASIARPEKLLYAWANNPQDRQLYNADGLPAIPFRIVLHE